MRKKPLTKVLSLLLALLMLLSSASLCISAVSSTVQATSASQSPEALDLSTYCLVRSEYASGDLAHAAALLRAHIENYTGVKIELKDDSSAEQANEILIGTTNRSAASTIYNVTTGENWAVKQIGSKVVLAAGDLCDIVNATNWFVENCIRKNSNTMVVGEGYATNNATRSYEVSDFTIGSYKVNTPKITYISSDNVAYKEAAVLLADNIRRMSGITPIVTTYSDSASGQILIASQTNGGSYSAVSAGAMQYAITKRNNNIIIVSNDEMGAEMGAQEIIRAMKASNGATIDLASFVKASAYNYTYSHNLDLDYGAEYRIMTYNILRYDPSLNTATNPNKSTNDRYDEAYNTVLFYNPDVVGFQEFCVNYHANMRPTLEANGYAFVAPTPELYNANDNTCSGKNVHSSGGDYDINSNYTPIAYKKDKFDLLASGSKRIIPCRPDGDYDKYSWLAYSNKIQPKYGWPGYSVTWAVLRDKTTGDIFAVTSLHNLTGQTDDNAKNKIDSLAIVKNIVDERITKVYSCPVFMVGDYNSYETMADIQSFANEANNIHNSRYLAEYGYSIGNSTITPGKVTCSGTTASNIDQLFVRGNARILRHRYAHSYVAAYSSDHKPVFIDVVVGESGTKKEYASAFAGATSSLKVNTYVPVENVIGDILSKLAITEIMPAPSNSEYEYIEIKNTGNFPIDISEYYLYRFGFSNGGQHANLAAGINKLVGLSATLDKLVKVSLADIIGDKKELAPGEVAIIWIQSLASKTNNHSVSDFKGNWNLTNSNVNVLTLKVHDGSKNLYPVGTGGTSSSTGYINSSAGEGFLADKNAGMVLSLIHKDSNINGTTVSNDDIVNNRSAEFTRARHAAADCSALLITNDLISNKAANYFDYVDIAKFNESAKNVTYSDTITTIYSTDGLIPESLLVPASRENLVAIENTNTSDLSAVPFINVTISDIATPGTLLNGQFDENGKLAITEICYNPENAKYEFVEVVNTSDNLADLRNYYVYRFGFSNGGTWHASGICQLLGYNSQPCAKLVKLSLANVTGNTILTKNEVALLWFASASSKNEDISAFKSYWTSKGSDMTNVNVIKVPVYDANGTNQFPANTVNGNAGASFLPDKQTGFVISMINKSFANTDDLTNLTANYTQERHTAADTSAFVLLDPSSTTVSAHFNEYINADRFNEARTNAPAAASGYTRKVADPIYANLMAYDSSMATVYANATTVSDLSDIVFPSVHQVKEATPGTTTNSSVVVEGVQTKKNDNNTADLRFVASLKGSYLDYLGAGFEFTVTKGNSAPQTATVNCKHVYTTLNSNAGIISPEEYGADYFFCYTLKNVSAGTYTISIRSWSLEDGASAKTYSQTKTVTVTVSSNGSVSFS